MKKTYYTIIALIIFNANAIHTIGAVYVYNQISSPATLEFTAHYFKPTDSTENLSIPLKNGRNVLADYFRVDRIIVQKVVITTQSGIVTVPINRTFNLIAEMEAHYGGGSYIAIRLNPDMSVSIDQVMY